MVWLDMQCLYYYLELQINNHNFHTLCVLCYRFVTYMTCILQIYLRLPMFINTILVVITFSTGTNKARKLLRFYVLLHFYHMWRQSISSNRGKAIYYPKWYKQYIQHFGLCRDLLQIIGYEIADHTKSTFFLPLALSNTAISFYMFAVGIARFWCIQIENI